jgi:hypothetical protein
VNISNIFLQDILSPILPSLSVLLARCPSALNAALRSSSTATLRTLTVGIGTLVHVFTSEASSPKTLQDS